jgi:POT family proton-dependent oligopeptide transporter
MQTHAGVHYGFGAAAVGTALGLGQYVVFRRDLGTHGREVPNPLPHKRIALYTVVAVLAVVVIAILLANLSQVTTGVIVVASVTYFVANAMFWSLFQ